MADRGPHLGLTGALLLLMVAQLATVSAESYQKFLREHLDYPLTQVPESQRYCDLMMKRRNLATARHCKHLNTFLHVDTASVQAVCGQGGTPTTGDLRESHASFPLTLCRLQRGSWAPDCRYQGSSSIERIVIACEEGYPVHLQTEIPESLNHLEQAYPNSGPPDVLDHNSQNSKPALPMTKDCGSCGPKHLEG